MYNLDCRYDSRKDFYGKAKVLEESKTKTLFSYGTKVAQIKNGKYKIFGYYSETTARHINEFLLQNGFNKLTKQEIIQLSTEV